MGRYAGAGRAETQPDPGAYCRFVEKCGGCGFAYDLELAPGAAAAIVAAADEVAGTLLEGSMDLRARRDPHTWSALEYACHVRDVLLVQRERVLTARRVDRPSFDPMGRDERVEYEGYSTQDPVDVARQMSDAARLFARVLDRLDARDWDRLVVYSYPTQAERSLRWVSVHTEHELVHHLLDIRRQLS